MTPHPPQAVPLLPQEKAIVSVHSPMEILIFLDHYKRDVEGAVPYRWILNLCRPVGERLAAPETNGLIKIIPLSLRVSEQCEALKQCTMHSAQ